MQVQGATYATTYNLTPPHGTQHQNLRTCTVHHIRITIVHRHPHKIIQMCAYCVHAILMRAMLCTDFLSALNLTKRKKHGTPSTWPKIRTSTCHFSHWDSSCLENLKPLLQAHREHCYLIALVAAFDGFEIITQQ